MKTPICRACLSSETLCKVCQGKLNRNEIRKEEIEVARALHELSLIYPTLSKVEFNKAISKNNLIFIFVPEGSAGKFIGKEGMFIKELSKKLEKIVKVVEETTDIKELVKRALYPAKVLSFNVVSDENEMYKIKVDKADTYKIYNLGAFEKLFKEILGKEAKIYFE